MKVLHFTLKRKWFLMILSGEKKEEYREMKRYWQQRLSNEIKGAIGGDFMNRHAVISYTFKDFDVVRFKNGYSKDAPEMDLECQGIDINVPIAEWTDDDYLQNYFVIKLGKILSTKNIK